MRSNRNTSHGAQTPQKLTGSVIKKRGRGSKINQETKSEQIRVEEPAPRRSLYADTGFNLVRSSRPGIFQEITAANLDAIKKAIWIDVGNESSTYKIASKADQKTLDRVEIARAFTPYQHNTLANKLDEITDSKTELLLLPNLDTLYHELSGWEKRQMLKDTWSQIKQATQKNKLKTIYSIQNTEKTIPRILASAENFITDPKNNTKKRYYKAEGQALQTTMNYWRKPTCEVKTNGENKPNIPQPARQIHRTI